MPEFIAIMRYFDGCAEIIPENECVKIFHANDQELLWEKVDMARRECLCIEVEYFHYAGGGYMKGA